MFVEKLIVLTDDKSHWDLSQLELLEAVTKQAFAGDPDRVASILESYTKPPPEPEDDDGWDSEYEELLEELCIQDNTNAQ